ncbi:MAG: ATP-binding protein [Wenzhouxiangella sp.]
MISTPLVVITGLAYLLLLFAIAWYGDQRAAQGRSIIASPWVYALSIAVYATAWTYFGSVGRASVDGIWFLPIYLGPTLAMILGWIMIRKMIRIACIHRITSIADFIASRYGKSTLIAGLVTLITVVGIVPYIALQLKAISASFLMLTGGLDPAAPLAAAWWRDSAFYVAVALTVFIILFGTRHLDVTERHEGMVAAIAFESLVKLLAFLAVGLFVVYGLFNGLGDLFAQAMADAELAALLRFEAGAHSDYLFSQWFGLVLLAGLAFLFLPRQFQVMVVENVDERHLKRAVWVFPLYLLLINLFVLPIALAGLMLFANGGADPDLFVLSLPLGKGHEALALFVWIGGLSAATGMVIVEAIAVSTMICNHLVLPLLLRTRRFNSRSAGDVTRLLLNIRRFGIAFLLGLAYLYFFLAGEAYALVSIGLISFAAVAQFAPAALGGMYWKGGTARGVLTGLVAGFGLWVYTLMLPSIARSGWISAEFVEHGPFGWTWLRPEQLLGLSGLDPITHSLFWSLLANITAYVLVSLWNRPSAREASQALLFVDVVQRGGNAQPVFWRGRARVEDLRRLASRFLGTARTQALFANAEGLSTALPSGEADARLVQRVETQLAGAIGGASARVMMASVVNEEDLELDDVMRILDEASQLRVYSRALEEKSRSLQQATEELRSANEQLKSLDRLKDDFMSSVTHELRTPLTSIRALTEMMLDDAAMAPEQRREFLAIIVAEAERLSRLVGQVLDMARIEAGHADWHHSELHIEDVIRQAVNSMRGRYEEKGARISLVGKLETGAIQADSDRLVQVMLNLLSNALRFVPHQQGQVAIEVHEDAGGVTVSVSDNGPGIAAEDQAQVFERFRQVGNSAGQGSGLGLPISRQIVEHFGGSMWLESSPGEGARFSFFLPRHPAPANAAEQARAEAREEAS